MIGFTDNTYCCGTVNPYRKACFSCLFCILKDEARIQKVTKRMHTLEEVNNNVKLLNEMLVHYSKEDSSEADRELMKELCERCETKRRTLFKLASETEDNDSSLGKISYTSPF